MSPSGTGPYTSPHLAIVSSLLSSRQFAWVEPIDASQVLASKYFGIYPVTHAQQSYQKWKSQFLRDFGVNPESLDIHDYTKHLTNVSLRLLFKQCIDSSLPFYFPWLFLDEADVVLIYPESEKVIVERIQQNCPPVSDTKHACLIYIRAGQFREESRVWVLTTLLSTMESRKQKFVLVTAWQEIWCTPYTVFPAETTPTRKRIGLSPAMIKAINNVLNSPLLLSWYGKNICGTHPKLHPVPLGAKETPNGIKVWERMFKSHLWFYLGGHRARHLFSEHKSKLLAAPLFEVANTESPAYTPYRYLRKTLFAHIEKEFGEEYLADVRNLTQKGKWPNLIKLDAISYFEDTKASRFSFAPTGAAIDSHRAWETLLLGSIPILHETTLDPLFEHLPAVFLPQNDPSPITPAYLKKEYFHIRADPSKYDWESLYGFYWLIKIRQATLIH
jgi:hypothetical protein